MLPLISRRLENFQLVGVGEEAVEVEEVPVLGQLVELVVVL